MIKTKKIDIEEMIMSMDSEEEMAKALNKIEFKAKRNDIVGNILCCKKCSKEFILEFTKTDYHWYFISFHQNLTEDFIREYAKKLNWCGLTERLKLSEQLLRDYVHTFNLYSEWENVSRYQNLSNEFIRDYSNKLNWYKLCLYQNLSDAIICEFSDKIYWQIICENQKLSENIIRKFKRKFYGFHKLRFCQNISKELLKELADSDFRLKWELKAEGII